MRKSKQFCVFRVANRHTFKTLFDRDLADPDRRNHYRGMLGDMVVEYLSASDYQLQEDGHASYWGQLAMRNCLRLAYNGGAVRGGRCVRAANGLDSHGEPRMGLQ